MLLPGVRREPYRATATVFGSGGTSRSITRLINLPPIAGFTIEGWVLWDGTTGGAMWGFGNTSAFYNSYISTSDSNNLKIYNGSGAPSTSPFPSDGLWHHVATVISGTGSNQIAVWLDGAVHGLNDGDGSITATNICIGDEPPLGFGWGGALAWVGIHNKALGAEEIAMRMARPWDLTIGNSLNTLMRLAAPQMVHVATGGYGGNFTQDTSGFAMAASAPFRVYSIPTDMREMLVVPQAAAGGTQTITLGGVIASGEAFFQSTLTAAAQITLGATIASGETFFAPTLSTYVAPTAAIPTGEAFFNPSLIAAAQITLGGAIATGESVPSPGVGLNVAAGTVGTGEAFFTHTLTAGSQITLGGAIATAESVPSPSVGLDIAPGAKVASGETFFTHTLTAAGQITLGSPIATAESVPSPVVADAGGQTVAPDPLSSGESVPSPTLALHLTPGAPIATGESLPSPALALYIDQGALGTGEVVFAPGVGLDVAAGALGTAENVRSPSLGLDVAPAVLASGESFPQATVTIYVNAGALGSGESVPSPTMVLELLAAALATLEAVPQPSLVADSLILPGTIASGETFYVAVTTGGVTSVQLSNVIEAFAANVLSIHNSPTSKFRETSYRYILSRDPEGGADQMFAIEAVDVRQGRAIIGAQANRLLTVNVRVSFWRSADRQAANRHAMNDMQTLSDICENPDNYDTSTTGIREIKVVDNRRVFDGPRSEHWEARFEVEWQGDWPAEDPS